MPELNITDSEALEILKVASLNSRPDRTDGGHAIVNGNHSLFFVSFVLSLPVIITGKLSNVLEIDSFEISDLLLSLFTAYGSLGHT